MEPSRARSIDFELSVRFSETDANGHVSHLSYLIYCEEARTRLMASLGYRWGQDATHLVLAHQSITYQAPAFFPERLRVETRVTAVGRSSLTLAHRIVRSADGAPIAESTSTVVLVDHASGRSTPWPSHERAALMDLVQPTVLP